MPESSESSAAEQRAERKSVARNDRLTLKKMEEEVQYRKFREVAMANCATQVKAFADCAESSGFMVILKCREQSKAAAHCLEKELSASNFDSYLEERGLSRVSK